MSKVVHILIPDEKSPEGLWVSTTATRVNGEKVIFETQMSRTWQGMRHRVHNQAYKDKFPTYEQCTENFGGYQNFADWCVMQDGYYRSNVNGKRWALDKDILLFGNKVYSQETCVFVPEYVNNLLVQRGLHRGPYPLGVSKISGRSKKYVARCCTLDGRTSAKPQTTPELSHKDWQRLKYSHILQVIDQYRTEPGYREDVCDALHCRSLRLQQDLKLGIETLKL